MENALSPLTAENDHFNTVANAGLDKLFCFAASSSENFKQLYY